MNKVVKVSGNRSVTIISVSGVTVSHTDAEMDARAREAVKSAIHKAKTCRKPIAKYDRINHRAYLETQDGRKIYVR